MKSAAPTAKNQSNPLSESINWQPLRKPAFLVAALVLVAVLFITYSNHFHNPFHFDDAHTIVNNTAIRDLGNIPRFFSDATTSSTLPANQAWRPGVSTLNAIDTWISGGTPDSFYFHISIFSSYVLLGILLFFFFWHILRKAFPQSSFTHWAALIGTGWFWLHTANAETINYVIARTDSFSTMMILLAFVMYFYSERSRNYFLFLLPVFFGFFVKEPAIMVAPILLVYVLIFSEKKQALAENQTPFFIRIIANSALWLFRGNNAEIPVIKSKTWIGIIAAFALAIILYLVSRAMTLPTWTSGGGVWYMYAATQTFVIAHYFNSFLLPVNLSADTDWTLVSKFTDDRVMIGTIFILGMILLAKQCTKRQETKPIAFGIYWFFIALIPTSSVFSFAEVLNDHRTFFPYIGLTLAFITAGLYLVEKTKEASHGATVRIMLLVFSVLLLGAHAAGTHHRNTVWSDGEKLWKDVTEKSPGNGRGWMNYGLALMAKNDMTGAIACYEKALQLYPNYSYAHINMGIALNKTGKKKEAEANFRKAVEVAPYNPEGFYYYGLFLIEMQEFAKAKEILEAGKAISPMHEGINIALAPLQNGTVKSAADLARETAEKNPTADNYINLSLALYNAGDFTGSAKAAEEAAKIKPDYAIAYNNICAAYNRCGEFELAEAAGTKAVSLLPNDELSRNNYAAAVAGKKKFAKLEADAASQNNYNVWISLSLEWYLAGNFSKSITAAEKASVINPNQADAWNNICAAANNLKEWDKAIAAGEKAVKLDPKSELAKNNLIIAKNGKGAK